MRQLVEIPILIFRRLVLPVFLVSRRHLRVHGRSVLGKLAETHPRILLPELLTHGALIQQIGALVALWGVGVSSGRLALLLRRRHIGEMYQVRSSLWLLEITSCRGGVSVVKKNEETVRSRNLFVVSYGYVSTQKLSPRPLQTRKCQEFQATAEDRWHANTTRKAKKRNGRCSEMNWDSSGLISCGPTAAPEIHPKPTQN